MFNLVRLTVMMGLSLTIEVAGVSGPHDREPGRHGDASWNLIVASLPIASYPIVVR